MARTVIVGDVHGCADELDDLFERVALSADDRVVMVGDLVVRGPKPCEVLDIVRRVGAEVVRGNHEQRLLDWRDRMERSPRGDRGPVGRTGVRYTGSLLRPEDWQFIATLPLWIELEDHSALVVHAGIVPGVPLEQQRVDDLLRMRCIDHAGRATHVRDAGDWWGASYRGPPHVVFGHNALNKAQIHPHATGLDTGCVYGRELTALVLAEGEPVPREPSERLSKLVSVTAHHAYAPMS